MARTKSVNVWVVAAVIVLVVGGCSQLINSVFGSDNRPGRSAPATPGPLPQLVGMTLVEAENQVEALGLRLQQRGLGSSYCSDETDCIVYVMSPKAGATVMADGKVAVRFVTSDEKAFYGKHLNMPKVVGWSEAKAEAFFEPISGAVDSASRQTTKVPYGKYRVVDQFPKPGKPLKLGQKIKLVIGHNYDESTSTGDTNVDVDNNGNRNTGGFCRRSRWC
ncbi:PASTA domain-containing protein [Nonomuraea sp. NPDC050790]|uniref:PASTA domain-containing protein n=1 Tax=Nonomuraea sp. NPDC050790 TaxID=3364371 RepID=UPI00378BE12D